MSPRERPMLFSGPMVRAILEGRKTVTRRVVTPQPAPNKPHDGGTTWVYKPNTGLHVPYGTVGHLTLAEKHGLTCPYGQPGERLWVRETWGLRALYDVTDWCGTSLKGVAALPPCWALDYKADWAHECEEAHWRPSIHMPRWASRLTLEVVSVRVERLQDITEEDAKAEGAEPIPDPSAPGYEGTHVYRDGFRLLWEFINGAGSWQANPWVWRVEFKRVEAGHG